MKMTQFLAGALTVCTLAALPVASHADNIAPDMTFGTLGNGAVIDSNVSEAHAVVIVSGNKLLVANAGQFGISRYNSDGSLDTTFGTSGRANVSFNGTTAGGTYAIVVQPDGKIVIGGSALSPDGTQYVCAVARLTSTGAIDTTFSSDGKLTFLNGNVYALAIQSDGKVVASGYYNSPGYGIIARFSADGIPDSTFGSNGRVSVNNGNPTTLNGFNSLAIQSDGKLVVTGSWSNDFVTCRYNTNGSPDTTFGTNGKIFDSFGSGSSNAYALALLGTKILVVGDYSGSSLAYARYNADGTLDTTFGTGGHVLASAGSTPNAYALKVLSGNKFLVVGKSGAYALTARVNANGTPDTTFNANGYYIGGVDSSATFDYAYAVAVQSDGKIVLAGTTGSNTYKLMLQRLTVTAPAAVAASTSSSAPGS